MDKEVPVQFSNFYSGLSDEHHYKDHPYPDSYQILASKFNSCLVFNVLC